MECCGEPFAVNDIVEWDFADAPDVDWLMAAVGRISPVRSPTERITTT
jgi:hypothetical protein